MEISNFLGISIVGVGLSFAIEVIKQKFGTDSLTTKGLTLALALALGAGYAFLVGTEYYTAVLGVLATASTVYAFLLK